MFGLRMTVDQTALAGLRPPIRRSRDAEEFIPAREMRDARWMPPTSWPAEAGHPRRAPGMALILEVQVLYGPIGRNR